MESQEKKLALIDEVLARGVVSFADPDGLFKQKLRAKVKGEYDKEIVIKLGVDPTRPDIHLGHAVGLRKLRTFQDLGCKIVFLVGDFTARIGDPTGKSKVRPEVNQAEVEKNMETFLEQIGKIVLVDNASFSWIRNSDWFLSPEDLAAPKKARLNLNTKIDGENKKTSIPANSFLGKALYYESTRMQKTHLKRSEILNITLRSFLWTLKHTTHSQLIDRDMFQERFEKGEELYMHEMMYPVLQGIDSYVLNHIYGSCDLEIGGTDQTFNMLIGRDVMRANKAEPQAVLSFSLIEGTDGTEKMSKSQDNYIGITESPEEMYGKVMSIKDHSIGNYFRLAALTSVDEVERIEKEIETGQANPRDVKMRLAREIVSLYHGEAAAQAAEKHFVDVFQKHTIPEELETVEVKEGTLLVDALIEAKAVSSRSEFRRLVEASAIKTLPNEERISDVQFAVQEDIVVKVGKKTFLRIKTE